MKNMILNMITLQSGLKEKTNTFAVSNLLHSI